MTKVTIVWPNGPTLIKDFQDKTIAAGPLYLAKVLEANGFEATVVDGSILVPEQEIRGDTEGGMNKLVQIIEKTQPDILGIGSWTVNMPHAAEISRIFKARNEDIPVVMGGHNPTFLPNETLSLLPHIDYLIRGEGEYTFLELVQRLSRNERVESVKGISYLKEGRVINNPSRPLIPDLNELPFIDLENVYQRPKDANIAVFYSRGCWANCSYCSINAMWGKERYFSVDYVINQVKHILELYPNIGIRYDSDSFLTNLPWARKIADEFHKNFPDRRWHMLARMDSLTKENIKYFESRGLGSMFIGIESVIPETLRFFGKTTVPEYYVKRCREVLEILKESSIKTSLSFIYGAPNETAKDFETLNKFIESLLGTELILFGGPITLYPGTTLWNSYCKGEIQVYRRPEYSGVMLNNITLAEKYSNLVWMAPDRYRIKSNVLSPEELEKNISKTHEIIHREKVNLNKMHEDLNIK